MSEGVGKQRWDGDVTLSVSSCVCPRVPPASPSPFTSSSARLPPGVISSTLDFQRPDLVISVLVGLYITHFYLDIWFIFLSQGISTHKPTAPDKTPPGAPSELDPTLVNTPCPQVPL